MAAKLKENFGIEATLTEGAGGIFDVRLDDDLVYSKHETGQFPDEEALTDSLQDRIG